MAQTLLGTTVPALAPLLAAKARVPWLPRVHLPRSHLVDALTAALRSHRLVVLAAGALSGKTTLLAELAASPTWGRVVWYTVDDLDTDAHALLEGVAVAACGTVPSGDDTELLAQIIGALEASPAPVALLIDDSHCAAALPQVADRLLRYLPPHAHLLLSGRPAPQGLPPLYHWLDDCGQVACFETADLRLMPEEQQRFQAATGYAGGAWAVGYRPGGQAAVVERLRLGALPVLSPESYALVELLAVLPAATAALAAGALDVSEVEAAGRLRLLAQQTILLERLDAEHYRLGEAAREASLARLGEQDLVAVRENAAVALEPTDPCLAAHLFALSGHAERAMAAARGAPLWEWQHRQATALAIERLVPAGLIGSCGALALTLALWRFARQGAAAAHALAHVARPATAIERVERLRLLGRCAVARGHSGDLRRAIVQLAALTGSHNPQMTATVRAYGLASLGGLQCLCGEYRAAVEVLHLCLGLLTLTGDDGKQAPSVRLLALHTLALAHRRLGLLDEAEALYAQAQARAEAESKPYAQLELANNRAVLLQSRGRHEESTALVREALASPWVAESGFRPVLLATLADALAALNDPTGAAEALRAAIAETPEADLYGIGAYAHAMLALLLAEGGQGSAAEVEIAAGAAADHPATQLARALLRDPRTVEARTALERALQAAGNDAPTRAHAQAHLARVCALQGDRPRARTLADVLAHDQRYPLTAREAAILGPSTRRVRRPRGATTPAGPQGGRIALRFFGRPVAHVDGQALGSAWWWQSKSRELFWYALAHGTQGFTREEACADLYPELDGAAASRALRNVLYELRKLIAAQCGIPNSVTSHQGRLQLLPGDLGQSWGSDLQTLEGCLRGLRQGRLVSGDLPLLLSGSFLADLTADWTRSFRYYWEQEAVQALELAAGLHEAAGRVQEALACLRRELEFCPDDVALVQRVMRLCHAADDLGGVRAIYLRHCRSAREDLEISPDPAVTALYGALVGA